MVSTHPTFVKQDVGKATAWQLNDGISLGWTEAECRTVMDERQRRT